jgi:hypothetical protein
VDETTKRFLDLGLDEGLGSEPDREMELKQRKYEKEFSKMKFEFLTHNFDIPRGHVSNEDFLDKADEELDK